MNTQIYNGYVLNDRNRTLMESLYEIKTFIRIFAKRCTQKGMNRALFEFATKIALAKTNEDIEKAKKQLLPKTISETDAQQIMHNLIEQPKKALRDIFHAWIVDYRITKQYSTVFPEFNVISKLHLFPYENKIYIIPFASDFINEYLKKYEFITDFSYWNDKEKPENISKKEWESRKKIWEKLIPNDNILENSLSCDIIYEDQNFEKNTFFNYTTFNNYVEEEREQLIRNLIIEHCFNNKSIIKELAETPLSTNIFSELKPVEVINITNIVNKKLDKRQFNPKINEIYNMIDNLVPKNYENCHTILKNKESIIKGEDSNAKD